MASSRMSPTVFVVYDGFQSLDLSGPWEVLDGACKAAGREPRLRTASLDGRPVRSTSGLVVSVDAATSTFEGNDVDTLVVVGGDGTREAVRDERLVGEIRRLAEGARRVASVCSGAFLLGAAGLLEGRRATTHWAYCDLLADRNPGARIDPDPIYVQDGALYTSAGVTAGIDLALAFAEEDFGREVALQVARMLVVYARRPGGQSQFSVPLARQMEERTPVRTLLVELQAWIAEHLDDDLSVAALSERVHLSERQLARVFPRELGVTPAEYVEQVRVEAARSALETGGETTEVVARRCGFASAEVMRRAFRRRLGVSPAEYRERFSSSIAA